MFNAILSRLRRRRTQSTSLVVLLLLALGVTGFLTYQANEADQDHRTNTEWLLTNYSALVATRYAEVASMSLSSFGIAIFRPILKDSPEPTTAFTPELPPEFIKQCQCDPLQAVRIRFSYDFVKDSFVAEPRLTGDQAAKIRDVFKQNPGVDLHARWRMVYANDAPEPDQVLLFVVRHDNDTPISAYGLTADRSILAAILPQPVDFVRGLPRQIDRDVTFDNVFNIAVESPTGVVPAGTKAGEKTYNGTVSLGPAWAGVKITASLNPEAAVSMLKAGAPKSRLPMLVTLLLITAALIGVSVVLLRHQSSLARERADFASSVSHELRTPLAQIRMFTETLLLGRVRNDAERRRSLEIIDQEARRLTLLVENVLLTSRMERGAARVAPADIEIAPAVREIVDMFAQLPKAKAVQFRLELQDRLHATADRNALTQILQNLLENAVKYGPSGQRIDVGLALFDDRARLWVDDEGPGIPARERERVFEMFYRSARDMESRVLGSGLGLAVVRQLADLLGGRVWAEDAPGGGARIVVEFPDAYLRAEESETGWAVA